jgi:Ser/Thr protein kinase RdoA (MazF antagonist)
MPQLFAPDIFSGSRPVFGSAAAAAKEMVTSVARDSYALEQVGPVEQFGGNEINSNNFKLDAAAGRFLLKRLPVGGDQRALQRQLELSDWLAVEQGVAIPRIVRTKGGELCSEALGYRWCLFEFVEGDFFNGGDQQLRSTALAIGRLQSALGAAPAALAPPKKWSYGSADDPQVLHETAACRRQWAGVFGEASGAVLEAGWERVTRTAEELDAHAAELRAASDAACHCDLHPHNLLVARGSLRAFIDFESFVSMPVAAALGFAAYKLVRQHAVATSLGAGQAAQIAAATRVFMTSLEEGGRRSQPAPGKMRLMAVAEIFRRLVVVLRLNVRERNPAWNHVLPMHLAALAELDIVYGA